MKQAGISSFANTRLCANIPSSAACQASSLTLMRPPCKSELIPLQALSILAKHRFFFSPAVEPNSLWGAALVEMVNNGTVPIERVDDMVTRTMTAYYKLGQDQGYPAVNFNCTPPRQPFLCQSC